MTVAQTTDELTVSFRDPAGRLVLTGDRALRFVDGESAGDLRAFLESRQAKSLLERNLLVSAEVIEDTGDLVVEHERIQWPSYPYEWPAEMLHSAAKLTLDLADEVRVDGFGLKDASPYNVLFRGPNPVFVDWLSFERRTPGDPTWVACSQFMRTFLLPLIASRELHLPAQQLLAAYRDGLDPEQVYRWTPASRRLSPGIFSLVSVPTWLSKRKRAAESGIYERRTLGDCGKADYIYGSLLRRLRRMLARVEPSKSGISRWSGYMAGNNNYSGAQFEAKERFVADAVAAIRPERVLDVGCNNGHFSGLAVRNGAREVVAIDSDPLVVGQTWRAASAGGLNVLPLVIDFTRPTPASGWRNREGKSFLDRARGSFDMAMLLAVLHHVLVNERVPLDEVLDFVAELTTDHAIVEFVSPEDSMFRAIVRGREHLHAGLDAASFEAACARKFKIVRSVRLPDSHRWLYWLKRPAC